MGFNESVILLRVSHLVHVQRSFIRVSLSRSQGPQVDADVVRGRPHPGPSARLIVINDEIRAERNVTSTFVFCVRTYAFQSCF